MSLGEHISQQDTRIVPVPQSQPQTSLNTCPHKRAPKYLGHTGLSRKALSNIRTLVCAGGCQEGPRGFSSQACVSLVRTAFEFGIRYTLGSLQAHQLLSRPSIRPSPGLLGCQSFPVQLQTAEKKAVLRGSTRVSTGMDKIWKQDGWNRRKKQSQGLLKRDWLGMVAQVCNPSTYTAGVGGWL